MNSEKEKKICKDCYKEIDEDDLAYLNGEYYHKCCLDWVLNS